MPFIALAILAVVLAGGGAYRTGLTNGANSERLRWQQSIAEANAKAEAAAAAVREAVTAKDTAISQVLASKQAQQDAHDAELEKVRQTIPLSADCTRCTIDARRLRQGTGSANGDPQTRVPASGTK
jgi:bacterioferritin-associated ferredoxin